VAHARRGDPRLQADADDIDPAGEGDRAAGARGWLGEVTMSGPREDRGDTPEAPSMTAWPFHAGELEAQQRAGFRSRGGGIRHAMPDQHREFFEALPFVVVASVDRGGPVATLLTGAPGFITAPDPRTLRIDAAPAADDPAAPAFVAGAPFGLLGIELDTRRRNRANGTIASATPRELVIAIRQSFGNCPQYIHPRDVHPASTSPAPPEHLAHLDPDATAAIAQADTLFVATSARTDEPTGGVDVSHRGGPAGFVRVAGDVLTIPDYQGNQYFNTLGNLMSDPRAALIFLDFARGDLLHVQGAAEIQWSGPEVQALDGAERLWRVHVERAWRRRTALPLRWTPSRAPQTAAAG
jgi:predicted pyridoxine 5'-phosphate oxidase superfamily flavin-nucleotide-binding protein